MDIQMATDDSWIQRRKEFELSFFGPDVRRHRRFEVDLGGAEWIKRLDATGRTDDPEAFVERYEGWIKPLLLQVEECLVVPRKLGTVKPVRIYERWEKAGATPEKWQSRYFAERDGQLLLDLREEVLNDTLFWWWVYPGLSHLDCVLVSSVRRFDAAGYFGRVLRPRFVHTSVDRTNKAWQLAKRLTQGTDRVAFILMKRNLTLTLFTSSANIEQLFATAVEHAARDS